MKFAFASRPWAIPGAGVVRVVPTGGTEPRRHKTPIHLAMGLTAVLIHWFPRRKFILLGDGGYASHELAKFCHLHGEHEFLKIHAKSLWACDFISKKIWTLGGLVDYYLLFFIHLETRQVIVIAATAQPNAEWVAQQGRNMLMEVEDRGPQIEHLLHDWDTKFTSQFDALIESAGAAVHRVGPVKPNLNAYAERFVQSIQQECLDHFIVLGPKHLDYLVREYIEHYHHERPHQAMDNAPPLAIGPPRDGEIVCGERLGGLLKHFYRKAA